MTAHDVENGIAVNNTRAGHISFFNIPYEHMKKAGECAHISYGGHAGFNGRYIILFLLAGMVDDIYHSHGKGYKRRCCGNGRQ